ncbi:MAG: fused MFS/spermidine synthase [Chloroflexi bacterium]|nr:fused MFS/spermidine synthase [Chloroflexota bacterium]
MNRIAHATESLAIVFMASLCTLVLELVAGRVLAPYIGVSLYTWTSIIGIVLAGISLGNYLGGKLADRWASRTTLAIFLLTSALASLAILPLLRWVTNVPLSPLLWKIVAVTSVTFFLPSLILGMVSPVVIKLTLVDLDRTGTIVGKIYAFSTAGSILGTFLTGFYLIPWFSTRGIIWAVAGTLLAMAVLVGRVWQGRVRTVAAVGTAVLFAVVFFQKDVFGSPCYKETSYYCIQVYDVDHSGKKLRVLALDHLVHSYTKLDDPKYLDYGYLRIYGEITEYVANGRQALKTLSIGGGGYTFPRYVEAVYPGSQVDVLEIDPGVTETNYEQLGLSVDTTIATYNMDARMVLAAWNGSRKYDLVFGDAFNDLSVPYHLTTLEFGRLVRDHLTDDGVYLVNVVDNFKTGQFVRAFVNTLREVFPHVYLTGPGAYWDSSSPSTYVIVAANRPLDLEEFRRVAGQDGQKTSTTAVLDPSRLEEWRAQEPRIVLTDDYNPVDNLIAPLFLERGY